MVDKEEIEEEVRKDLNIIQTGKYYIAEATYNGVGKVHQGETRKMAINNLILSIYEDELEKEQMEDVIESMEEEMEQDRRLSEQKAERAKEQAERERFK